MRPQSKFQVGDRIRVTSVLNCVYGSNDEMLKHLDEEGTVLKREWDVGRKIYAYRLSVDNCGYIWCDNCLELAQTADIEESDASLDVLLS